MNDNPASCHIHDPVFANSRMGVQHRFGNAVETQGCVGYFRDQQEIARAWMSFGVGGDGLGGDGGIRFRLTLVIVGISDIDGGLTVNEQPTEDGNQPVAEQYHSSAMWRLLTPLFDDLPIHEFIMPDQQITLAQKVALLARPAFAIRRRLLNIGHWFYKV